MYVEQWNANKMDNKGFSVVFRHENEEFVLQNGQIVLNRYYLEFNGEKFVDFILSQIIDM